MLLLILACSPEKLDLVGIPAFGYSGEQEPSLILIADSSDGLNTPRDLGINPLHDGEIWVVNRSDDSVTIVFNAGTSDQTTQHIVDPYAEHFMEEVSSIAFGAPETFGTCQETRNTYNNQARPDDFMGPTLWSSDLDIFGKSNPEAVRYLTDLFGFHADLGSHLDMLHESPLCMGIAWERNNIYWVFDGLSSDIVRYDFHVDHGPGYDDHSDGTIFRYAPNEVKRVPDVPSHMKLDKTSGLLYIADTGNNAIKVLDVTKGDVGDRLPKQEPGTQHYQMDNTEIWTLIEGADFDIELPSGLTLIDDILLIGDNATGIIHAFDIDGTLIDQYETGLPNGGLMGIYAAGLDDIWMVNAVDNELLRLSAQDSEGGLPSSFEFQY